MDAAPNLEAVHQNVDLYSNPASGAEQENPMKWLDQLKNSVRFTIPAIVFP